MDVFDLCDPVYKVYTHISKRSPYIRRQLAQISDDAESAGDADRVTPQPPRRHRSRQTTSIHLSRRLPLPSHKFCLQVQAP